MNEKVYCGKVIRKGNEDQLHPNCKWFVIMRHEQQEIYQCHEPGNLDHNPLAKGLPSDPPHEKNKDCNCKVFEFFDGETQITEFPIGGSNVPLSADQLNLGK